MARLSQQKFMTNCYLAMWDLRMQSPIRTGNLRYDAIRLEFPEPFKCVIYVDEKVAPYMKYTNEPWLNGRQNPNEAWWQEAVELVAQNLAERLQGGLVK